MSQKVFERVACKACMVAWSDAGTRNLSERFLRPKVRSSDPEDEEKRRKATTPMAATAEASLIWTSTAGWRRIWGRGMEYVEYYRVNRVNRIIVSVLGSNERDICAFPSQEWSWKHKDGTTHHSYN